MGPHSCLYYHVEILWLLETHANYVFEITIFFLEQITMLFRLSFSVLIECMKFDLGEEVVVVLLSLLRNKNFVP